MLGLHARGEDPGLPLPRAGRSKIGTQCLASTASWCLAYSLQQCSSKWGAHGNLWGYAEKTLDLQLYMDIIHMSIDIHLQGVHPQTFTDRGVQSKHLENLLERRGVARRGRKLLFGGNCPMLCGQHGHHRADAPVWCSRTLSAEHGITVEPVVCRAEGLHPGPALCKGLRRLGPITGLGRVPLVPGCGAVAERGHALRAA